MKIERRSGHDERQILTGMIVNPAVLGRVASRWVDGEGMFSSRWANLIGSWCIVYHNRYGRAPNKSIESMFAHWADRNHDEEAVKLVEKFLGTLSDGYEEAGKELNPDYIIDLAGGHFERVQLQKVRDAIEAALDMGDVAAARAAVNKCAPLELGNGGGVDVFQDEAAWQGAYNNTVEQLIEFPGDIGKFFGRHLKRGGFVTLIGPEKRGKTTWLMRIAFQAMRQRRRVAFFQVGDMTEQEFLVERLGPLVTKKPEAPGTIKIPQGIVKEEEEQYATVTGWDEVEYPKGLGWREAYSACAAFMSKTVKSNNSYFRLSTHPNDSISVDGIKTILQSWERAGWVADVICIDYADILAPIDTRAEGRDQINKTWKRLRQLSQSFHALVLTATQADAASYNAAWITLSNFSEDKRKWGHVTGAVALNTTPEEREQGIMRLTWPANRGKQSRYVHVAGCLDIANPAIRSCF